jgi:hypothetical protein
MSRFIADPKVITPIVAAIVAAIVGAIGFWLTPLKQRVYNFLYPPRIIIQPEPVWLRNPLVRGDIFVIKLHLVPEENSLARGEVEADVPADYLNLEEGNSIVDLDGTDKTRVLVYTFDVLKVGHTHVTYVYNFASGRRITTDVQLNVIDRREGFPTFDDLSGMWELKWKDGLGELEMIQKDNRLTGKFSVIGIDGASASKGTLTGWTTESNIQLDLWQDGSTKPSRANLFKVSERDHLTICGNVSSEKNEAFIGTIETPGASSREICENANLRAEALMK